MDDRMATRRWEVAAHEAAGCRACPLWADATQTVFGEGPVPARPVLDEALTDAGLDRGPSTSPTP